MRITALVAALLLGMSSMAMADSKCCTQTNGGGNVPNGTAVGVPNTNQGGNAPPGQQPSPPGQN